MLCCCCCPHLLSNLAILSVKIVCLSFFSYSLPTNDEEWLVLWVVHEVRARGGTSSGKSTSVLCVNATTTVHSSA